MTMKPDRNTAALKTDSRSENCSHKPKDLLRARLKHVMKHAAKIAVLAAELMVGPGAKELCQCGPVTKPILCALSAICHDFKGELTSLQALYCAECTD